MNRGVLLDTCAMIWLGSEISLREEARSAVRAAANDHALKISAVSAWELALAVRRRRNPLNLLPDLTTWLSDFARQPGMTRLPLSVEAALEAYDLPEPFHQDPADRLLVAQARELDVPIITRDRRILDYADQGHVRAIAC